MWSTNREVKWLDIGQVPLLPFYEPRRNRSQQIKTHKRNRPVWSNLDRSSLVKNENRFLLDHRGKPRAVQARWAANQNTGFAYSCPQNIQIPFCSHAFSRGLRQPHRFALWLAKKTTLAIFLTNKRETATNGGMLPRVLPRLRPVTRSVWTSVRFCRKHCLCLICEY